MECKPTNAGGENFYGDSPLTRTKIKFLFDKLFVVITVTLTLNQVFINTFHDSYQSYLDRCKFVALQYILRFFPFLSLFFGMDGFQRDSSLTYTEDFATDSH